MRPSRSLGKVKIHPVNLKFEIKKRFPRKLIDFFLKHIHTGPCKDRWEDEYAQMSPREAIRRIFFLWAMEAIEIEVYYIEHDISNPVELAKLLLNAMGAKNIESEASTNFGRCDFAATGGLSDLSNIFVECGWTSPWKFWLNLSTRKHGEIWVISYSSYWFVFRQTKDWGKVVQDYFKAPFMARIERALSDKRRKDTTRGLGEGG